MSVKEDIVEINKLDAEIDFLKKQLKIMRGHRKKVEHRILSFLEVNEYPGITYQGITILSQDAKKRHTLPKTEKVNLIHDLFREKGVSLSNKEVENFIESLKGELDVENKVKIFKK